MTVADRVPELETTLNRYSSLEQKAIDDGRIADENVYHMMQKAHAKALREVGYIVRFEVDPDTDDWCWRVFK